MSVTSAVARRPKWALSATSSSASRCASSRSRMNAAPPASTSYTIAVAPPAIFFDTIDAAMRPIARYAARSVAQIVEPFVGRHEACALGPDRAADAIDLRDELGRAEVGSHARDRLGFHRAYRRCDRARARRASRRAPRTQPPAERARADGIADAAARMFVDDDAVEYEPFARGNHRLGECRRFAAREPLIAAAMRSAATSLVERGVGDTLDDARPGRSGEGQSFAFRIERVSEPRWVVTRTAF